MKKQEFLTELRQKLSGLSQDDIDDRLAFYDEMIDEYVENGVPEEVAIAGIGSVDDIVAQVVSEIPLTKLVKEKIKPESTKKGGKAGKAVAMALTFPLWFPLLITAFVLFLTFLIVLWAIVVTLFACTAGFLAGAIGAFVCVIPWVLMGNVAGAVFMIGAAIICAGFTLLTLALGVLLSKGIIKLTGLIFVGIKSLFVGKEGKQNA